MFSYQLEVFSSSNTGIDCLFFNIYQTVTWRSIEMHFLLILSHESHENQGQLVFPVFHADFQPPEDANPLRSSLP